jgi:outer membrane protein assembly factor BamD
MKTLFLIPLAALPVLVSCAPSSMDFTQYPTPEAIYRASLEAYRTGNCDIADDGFQRLVFDLPIEDARQFESQYYLAECMIARREYVDAAREFRRMVDAFPRHSLAPDALLRAGDAYAEMWGNPELDPTYAETAVATYEELMQRFRGTPAAQRAQLRINRLNEMFAEKEYRGGVFYLRLKAYDSAIIYFKDVVAKYPQSPHAPMAVVRLVEVYDVLQYEEERDEMCQYLLRFYPGEAGGASLCEAGAPAR